MASKDKVKTGAVVKKCSCKHTQQDKMYGKGFRVFNLKTGDRATCTVCGNVIGV